MIRRLEWSPVAGACYACADVVASPQRRTTAAKIAVVLVVVAILVAAQQLGVFRQLADPAGLKLAIIGLGPWGYVAYVGAYAALQPFGFPGSVFIFGAPLVWAWPVAYAVSLTGTMAASVVGFLFARFVARDWVSARIPGRYRRYDEALARRAFVTVFLLRLVFWMAPPLHAFFGVSSVRFSTHFWGSLAGYVLPLLLVSLFGERMFEEVVAAPIELWIGLGVGVTIVGVGVWLYRRRRHAGPRR